MKLFIILSAVVAVVLAVAEETRVLSDIRNVDVDGSYQWAYELSNGVYAAEAGVGGVAAQGQFRYVSPEGIPVAINYIADENGFQPQGDVLPQPPPTPDAILRSLEYIRLHPPPPQKN